MATIRAWLTLGRIHTSALTIPGTLLGVLAAGHGSPMIFGFFGAWAFLFHYIGFSGNAIMDLPWDRKDPSKAHFPLVTGAVDANDAWIVYFFGLSLVVLMGGMFLTAAFAVTSIAALLAIFFLGSAVVNGIAYNRLCKKTLWAPLFISASFASLPAFAYFASGGTPSFGVWSYIVLYGFFLLMAQIAVAGYVKDLEADPVSLLRSLGARARTTGELTEYDFPIPVIVVGFGLRWMCPILAFLWNPTWPVVLLGILTSAAYLPMLRSQTVPRAAKVRWMGVSEILAYWLLLASLLPLLGGWLAFAAWAVLPLGWYVCFNKVLWNTRIAPRV